MLVADCASEALTTEDELRRERSGVQCEAQASLSALRRELPPALHLHLLELWLLLQLNSLLRVPYVRMHFRPSDQASWVVATHEAAFAAGLLCVSGNPPGVLGFVALCMRAPPLQADASSPAASTWQSVVNHATTRRARRGASPRQLAPRHNRAVAE
jgi:hypothetical protein